MKAQQFSSTLSSTHELIDRCRSKHREGTAGEETRQDRSFRLRRMDGVLKEFSDRADEAEKRLEYLEKAISSGEPGVAAMLFSVMILRNPVVA